MTEFLLKGYFLTSLYFSNLIFLTFGKFEENSKANTSDGIGNVQHHVQVDISTLVDSLPEKPVETDVLPDSEVLKLIPWENNPGNHRCKNVSQCGSKTNISRR